ncbi:MAG TPA: pentapeptide repeat-containing protein, partial [Flavisolibacter sp.]|nr:pentapeptide repeat-containing protein [Flavisolibacter sp.]
VKTGIRFKNALLIFVIALLISAFAGYIAMLAGLAIQKMLTSDDWKVRIVGASTILIIVLVVVYTYLKGGCYAITHLVVPVFIFSILVGGLAYFTGLGTAQGLIYQLLALLCTVVLLVTGVTARAAAGTLSNILFIVVALSGGLFSKSVGGGVGAAIMAISCALISKRALSGASGFEILQKATALLTAKLGTSFRNCKLAGADFSQCKEIRNCDFSNADLSSVFWGDCKKINCIQ